MVTRQQRKLIARIDRGYAHSLDITRLGVRQHETAMALLAIGYLRMMPARSRRFPTRWVITVKASYALGVFANDNM